MVKALFRYSSDRLPRRLALLEVESGYFWFKECFRLDESENVDVHGLKVRLDEDVWKGHMENIQVGLNEMVRVQRE